MHLRQVNSVNKQLAGTYEVPSSPSLAADAICSETVFLKSVDGFL